MPRKRPNVTDPYFAEYQSPHTREYQIGDAIGNDMVITSIGPRSPVGAQVCWCKGLSKWRVPVVHGDRFTDDDAVAVAGCASERGARIVLHKSCLPWHELLHDPIVRQPWGISVAGYEGFHRIYLYRASRRELHEWLSDHRGEYTEVSQWLRQTVNWSGYSEGDAALFPDTYVEDPANPLCETTQEDGRACMHAAATELTWDDGETTLVCTYCDFLVRSHYAGLTRAVDLY